MKKISLMAVMAALCVNASAQYKKASFFTRNGKFYGVAAGAHLYGSGSSVTPTVAFIYGKDQGKKHVWHWWDLEFTPSTKYSYTTPDRNVPGTFATVDGKVNGMLNWRYNWGFYFGDNSNNDIKGLPFAKLAVEVMLAGRGIKSETVTPTSASTEKYTYAGGNGNAGADIGVGYKYRLSEMSTVFGVAGYRWILNNSDGGVAFYTDPSHPYVTVGIRFSSKKDD